MTTAPVPICIDCRYYRDSVFPTCTSLNRTREFDPVHGYTYLTLQCRDARNDENLCGTEAKWFATPPKLTHWQRVKRWFFS
jgi:hypothetical protein